MHIAHRGQKESRNLQLLRKQLVTGAQTSLAAGQRLSRSGPGRGGCGRSPGDGFGSALGAAGLLLTGGRSARFMNDANNHATRVGKPQVRTADGLQPPSRATHMGIAIRGVGASLALLAGVALVAGCGGAGPAASVARRTPAEVALSVTPASDRSPGPPSTPEAAGPSDATAAATPNIVTPSSTVSSIAPPAATGTSAPPTPTAIATLPPPGAPLRSIAVGEWAFDYRLVGNSCGTTPDAPSLAVTQKIEEVSGTDGYISDGEQVRVYGFNGGASLGLLTFHWPTLSYQVPLNEPGGVRTEVTHTFADAHSGSSKVVEVYTQGAGACELTYAG